MDIKIIIESALKDYKRKKSIIETTLLRIENFKEAIKDPDSFRGVFRDTSKTLGMPRSDGRGSYIEREVIDKEEAVELLKEWIEDDSSRIYPYQLEIEQIDTALEALTKPQKYIIECKYFEDMFWREIEISFNDRFRTSNFITSEGIRKLNRQALDLLVNILEPYYNRFKVKK